MEFSDRRGIDFEPAPIIRLLREYFYPMKAHFKWGTNIYYFMSAKYGIHPSYIQEMLSDSRYSDEDIIIAIQRLRELGGKRFDSDLLEGVRDGFARISVGDFYPVSALNGKQVLIIGAGESVKRYRGAIEHYIESKNPVVMSLNTNSDIASHLINYRLACHPIRIRLDLAKYDTLPQPLIAPISALPDDLAGSLSAIGALDFGMQVKGGDEILIQDTYCVLPVPLSLGYALALATSGRASSIVLAGFDGYGSTDKRTSETQDLLNSYRRLDTALKVASLTPTNYDLDFAPLYSDC